jgi:hypothetical protein
MPRGIGQFLEQTFRTINRVGGDKSMISPMTGGKEKSRLGTHYFGLVFGACTHKSAMWALLPRSGHRAVTTACRFRATGGLKHRSNGRLFGPSDHRLRMTLV